jgi:hypothetical protein
MYGVWQTGVWVGIIDNCVDQAKNILDRVLAVTEFQPFIVHVEHVLDGHIDVVVLVCPPNHVLSF